MSTEAIKDAIFPVQESELNKKRLAEARNTFAYSLAKAQSQMSHAKFDKQANYGKYASLTSVIEAAKPLGANGICFIQRFIDVEGGVGIETVLHGFGHSESTGVVVIPLDKKNAHGVGTAMTYAKRYSLSMACGIAADEDDDAHTIVELSSNSTGRKSESVAKTTIRENNIVVPEAVRVDYATQLKNFANTEDDAGLKELFLELNKDQEMKIAVYSDMQSKLKTHLRKKEAAFREESKLPTKEFNENKEVNDGNH